MIFMPNINDYDFNALIMLGDRVEDERTRGKYRTVITVVF